jgi:hypothetical protein
MGTLRVKVNGAWVDVVTGMAGRSGFARRGSTVPAIPQNTWTAMPLDVLVSTSNWQWTYGGAPNHRVTCPVAGIYAIHASIATLAQNFPSGSFVTITINGLVKSRNVANGNHPYETLETSCEWPLIVGDTVGMTFTQEAQASWTGLRQADNSQSVDPPSPFLSCWRVSY